MTAGDWRAALDRLDGTVRRLHDTRPAWPVCTVLAVGRYSSSGESYVSVDWFGQAREASYLDGPAPSVGDRLMVAPRDNTAHAPLVALPLPQTEADIARPPTCPDHRWYVSARAGGTWSILQLDTAGGVPRWSLRSASPTAGDERYLFRIALRDIPAAPFHGLPDDVGGYAVVAWRYFTHGPGAGLYYSDDDCATWVAAGLSPVYVARLEYFGLMHACTAAGLYRSYDFGASWSAIPGGGAPAGNWRYVAGPVESNLIADSGGNSLDFRADGQLRAGNTYKHRQIVAVADGGGWYSINEFDHHAFPLDEADPSFVGEDPQDRSWNDQGGDDGAFTCDATLFGICVHRTFPFVVAKTYRDRYGPYGSPVSAGRRPFLTNSGAPGVVGGTIRPDSTATLDLAIPDRASLEAGTDPYDETAPKAASAGDHRYGGDTGHFNTGGLARFLVLDDAGVGGGVVWFWDNNDLLFWSVRDHPGGLSVAVADACRQSNGTAVCTLIALADATEGGGHAAFLTTVYQRTASPDQAFPGGGVGYANTNDCTDVGTTMRFDLGAYYVGGPDGIVAVEATP